MIHGVNCNGNFELPKVGTSKMAKKNRGDRRSKADASRIAKIYDMNTMKNLKVHNFP